MNRLSKLRLSPAMAVALAALVVAMAGTAMAASSLVNGDKLIKKGSLSGDRLRSHTLTGRQINLSSLGTVPSAVSAQTATNAGSATNATNATNATSANHATDATNANHAGTADALTTLPSGQSESGAFAGGGGSSTTGYFGFGITYPRPLATAIAESKIIDTAVNPDPTHCPGPGTAAPGYLCLYSHQHVATGFLFGHSTLTPYGQLPDSVGVGMYGSISGAGAFVDGIWTVTAP